MTSFVALRELVSHAGNIRQANAAGNPHVFKVVHIGKFASWVNQNFFTVIVHVARG